MLEATESFPSPKATNQYPSVRNSWCIKDQHTLFGNLDSVAKLTRLAVDFNTVVQEFLVRRPIKNAVICWLGKVNGELVLARGSLSGYGGGLGLIHTFT
jgi:hypothetical protein